MESSIQTKSYNTKKLRIYRQSIFEARLTLFLYGFYGAWWWVFFYYFFDQDVSAYSFILGFPSWFFYGCILIYPTICIFLQIVISLYFKDIDLNAQKRHSSSNVEALQEYPEKHPELL